MFLRWKKRKLKKSGNNVYDAVLVKSVKEGGKDKQEFVSHIGTIEENPDRYSIYHFWVKVMDKTEPFNLCRLEKRGIVEKVKERIPVPTEKELDDYDRKRKLKIYTET